jgi:hypothetical protein
MLKEKFDGFKPPNLEQTKWALKTVMQGIFHFFKELTFLA